MEKFIVSARKYRPQNFNTVVGQQHITTTLKNAIRNQQLAHAFLFCGPRGVGKTTCARILAKTINCENLQPDGEACNSCQSCVSFNEGLSLNIHELDAASNNSVDDIRSLVEQVRFAPQAGKYRVYIVDEVHMLSTSAFNAFLKTLEEPPPYAIFILATTEKHKILPTILSRCQIFDFKRITNNDTVEHLQEIADKEDIKVEKAALQVIAQKSEGCMRDSLSILDKIVSFTNGVVTYANTLEHLNILDEDYFFKLLETQLQQDMAGALLLFDEINRKGFEGDMVINGYAEFIRNILVCQNPQAASLLEVVEGMQSKYAAAAKRVTPAYLVGALNILSEAEINYKMARNKRLHVEMAIIKLTFLQQAIDLTYDRQTSTVVKKKRISGPIAMRFEPLQSLQINVNQTLPVKPSEQRSKLYIQQENKKDIQVKDLVNVNNTSTEKKIITAEKDITTKELPKQTIPSGNKKSLLEKMRHKVKGDEGVQQEQEIVLSMDNLKKEWLCFTEKLKAQSKNSHVTVFNNAQLQIINNEHFSINVSSSLEQKFIEQEKVELSEFLKDCFKNRNLTFAIQIDEQPNEQKSVEAPLNTREQYVRVIEKYPLIKELKDKLRLELDY